MAKNTAFCLGRGTGRLLLIQGGQRDLLLWVNQNLDVGAPKSHTSLPDETPNTGFHLSPLFQNLVHVGVHYVFVIE